MQFCDTCKGPVLSPIREFAKPMYCVFSLILREICLLVFVQKIKIRDEIMPLRAYMCPYFLSSSNSLTHATDPFCLKWENLQNRFTVSSLLAREGYRGGQERFIGALKVWNYNISDSCLELIPGEKLHVWKMSSELKLAAKSDVLREEIHFTNLFPLWPSISESGTSVPDAAPRRSGRHRSSRRSSDVRA